MWRDRPRDDNGSVLMLMPAAVLVVLVLGAIAVDAAVVFLGERELADLTAAAANDAATAGLAPDAFYRCGQLRVDSDRAGAVARTVSAARASDSVALTALDVSVRNDTVRPQVTVEAHGTVRLVFTPALPGQPRLRPVNARSTAEPHAIGPGTEGPPATCPSEATAGYGDAP